MKNIKRIFVLSTFTMIGCAQLAPVMAIDAEALRRHPSISIKNPSPNTESVKLVIRNPELELEMHRANSDKWTVELSDQQVNKILNGDHLKKYTANIEYEIIDTKGRSRFENKEIELLVKGPKKF